MPTKTAQATASQLDRNRGDESGKSVPQSSKSEKHKIIYNKKAESEFFVDNSALAGFTGERILYMAIRELIENSLDSCESFSILPSIRISLKLYDPTNDLWILSCEDNGTGINSEKIPVAVCSFLTSAKYMEKQQRGLFGVGLKMVAAFSTKDTDFPIKVWNRSIEETEEYYFELRTDIGTNKPIVLLKKPLKESDTQIKNTSGFRIQVVLRAKLVPITKNKIYEYVSETSIVNPYVSLTFETDDGIFEFNRRTSMMPNPAQEILPHPSDMDLKTLKKAISKFQTQKITLPKILCSSFQKLSYEKAKDIVSSTGLSIKTSTNDFSEHDLIKIVNICKKTKFQNPNTDHLSPIGKDVLTIGMMSEYAIVSNKNSDVISIEKTSSQNSSQDLDYDDYPANDTDEGSSKTHGESISATTVVATTTNVRTASANTTVDSVADGIPVPLTANNTVSPDSELLTPELSENVMPLSIKNNTSKSNFTVKVLKPVLTAYTSRTCVINNRPTVVETGLAYGGDIPSFKMYRFANKIPLLYDEGSDVAREVISEVEINKMGITKKQAKEQFSTNKESKKDRAIEVLPLHIFFHICSTKIPYKTAGKESIASEGELKYYMKSCLSELYRKLSTQIRKELKLKEAENKLRLYKHYLPFIVDSINESLGIKGPKLSESFSILIENHLSKRPMMDETDSESESLPISPKSSSADAASFPLTPYSKTVVPSTSYSSSSSSSSSSLHSPHAPRPASINSLNLTNIQHEVKAEPRIEKKNIPEQKLKKHKGLSVEPKPKPKVKKLNSNNDDVNDEYVDNIANQSNIINRGSKKVTQNNKLNNSSDLNIKKNRVQKEKEQKWKKESQSDKSFKNIDNYKTAKSKVKTGKPANSVSTPTTIKKSSNSEVKSVTTSKVQKPKSALLPESFTTKNTLNKESSSSTSQSKQQLQSTLDSYDKRVNKGKRLR